METLISGKNTEAEVELKTANIVSVIYEKIDEELRSTEATDISMYHAWMQVAPEVRRIIVDEAKEMINTVEENPAQCTRKTMDLSLIHIYSRSASCSRFSKAWRLASSCVRTSSNRTLSPLICT